MTTPVQTDDIQSIDWSPQLAAIGQVVEGLDDINQCIRIILETPKGGRTHEPLFGADLLQFIDWPVNQAMPGIIREVIEAVTLWEPRAEIVSIKATPDTTTGYQLALSIEWKLKGTFNNGTVEVNIAA